MNSQNQEAPRFLEISIGIILGLFGIGLFAILVAMLFRILNAGEIDIVMYVFFLVVTPISWFCLIVSYRLISGESARNDKGLLSPAVIKTFGILFIVEGLPSLARKMFRLSAERKHSEKQ